MNLMTNTSAPSFVTSTSNRVWVIDDDVALRTILQDALTDAGFEVQTFGQAKLAWQTLENLKHHQTTNNLPNVIITDIRMPMMDGLSFSEKMREHFPTIPVIIMTAHADVQSAVDSYQTGAFDYLPKPFDLDDAVLVIQKAMAQSVADNQSINNHALNHHTLGNPALNNQSAANTSQSVDFTNDSQAYGQSSTQFVNRDNAASSKSTHTADTPSGIVGQSAAMQKVFRAIGRLSHTPMTVLITGESGTGKELIAQALHDHSPRKNKPFIALNMAAIPHDLIEAELFGHEKGAFTGATTTRPGRFEQAHGGTLFLDEIGDMPLPTQTRLLRVLANGEFFRVGGQNPIKVDVRIIAATHQHLEQLVKQGRFREDLFYRLNVIRLSLPALRERREDIPLLVNYFMHRIAHSMQTQIKTMSAAAMQVLQAYDWQGNVRQLENVCRWLAVMATGQQVQISDLPPEILVFYQQQLANQAANINNAMPFPQSANHANTHSNGGFTTQTHQPSLISNTANNTGHSTLPTTLTSHLLAEQMTNPTSGSFLPISNDGVAAVNNSLTAADWLSPLREWAQQALARGEQGILQTATLDFEKCLLEVALQFTDNHKGQAAELLGWGRNTVTRKYQQLLK